MYPLRSIRSNTDVCPIRSVSLSFFTRIFALGSAQLYPAPRRSFNRRYFLRYSASFLQLVRSEGKIDRPSDKAVAFAISRSIIDLSLCNRTDLPSFLLFLFCLAAIPGNPWASAGSWPSCVGPSRFARAILRIASASITDKLVTAAFFLAASIFMATARPRRAKGKK